MPLGTFPNATTGLHGLFEGLPRLRHTGMIHLLATGGPGQPRLLDPRLECAALATNPLGNLDLGNKRPKKLEGKGTLDFAETSCHGSRALYTWEGRVVNNGHRSKSRPRL